jgi:HPt (histidine-containing phosphotransfer) domain-containing protein
MAAPVVAEERAAEIFDHGHLAGLSRGNIAFEHEVLRLFCAHLPVSLEALRACRGRPFREAAHTIKGAAAAIGAWRLARAAERAEGSDAGAPAARTAAIDAVCAAAAEACWQIGLHIGGASEAHGPAHGHGAPSRARNALEIGRFRR